ncbi:MAG: hypothetical protein ACYCVY_13090 [Acidiferrobacteraceae bacterium]
MSSKAAVEAAVRARPSIISTGPTPAVAVTPRAGVGYGCSEAPRGMLWHRYRVDDEGRILEARIVPPTSQNQARIEEDLRRSLEDFGLQHSDEELRLRISLIVTARFA